MVRSLACLSALRGQDFFAAFDSFKVADFSHLSIPQGTQFFLTWGLNGGVVNSDHDEFSIDDSISARSRVHLNTFTLNRHSGKYLAVMNPLLHSTEGHYIFAKIDWVHLPISGAILLPFEVGFP